MRALAVSLLLMASPAFAGTSSTYTTLDVKACQQVTRATSGEEGESSGILRCKGYGGLPVTFAEGDLRSLVAFGKKGENHCAFRQTFGGFNSVGNKVEWRLRDGKPFAAILRWTVSYDSEDSSKTKTWLVVSKIEPNNSCHMAYVEGAYPRANDAARRLVDSMARDFSCATGKPMFLANAGTATENIAANDGCQQ